MNSRKITPSKVITYVILSLWGLTTVYPFIWVVLNSFRKKGLIRMWLPGASWSK